MRLLLDTHVFLWWVDGGRRLTPSARRAIADSGNECLVSVASGWELAIKLSLGRIELATSLDRFLPEQLAANGFAMLPISLQHIVRVAALPFHHRDPFDRLLVAQALEDDLSVVSADSVYRRYRVTRIW